MSGFSNAVVGGAAKLIRRAIQSPNYVPATTGWSINKDGTVDLTGGTFRGSIIVGTTAGKRIEINVVLGSIQMFDATNAVVADWSSSAGKFIVYVAGTNQIAYVKLDTTFAVPAALVNVNNTKYNDGGINHEEIAGDGGMPTLRVSSGSGIFGRNSAQLILIGQSVTAGTQLPVAQFSVGTTGAVITDGPVLHHVAGTVATWQSPVYGSGWAANQATGITVQKIRYRIDAQDNLVILGAAHTTSATPAATLFTLPAAYAPFVTQRVPIVEFVSGAVTAHYLEINSSGAVSVVPNLAAASHDIYVAATVPLGNFA